MDTPDLLNFIFEILALGMDPSSAPEQEEDTFTQALKQDSRPVEVRCPHCEQGFDYFITNEKYEAIQSGRETRIITTCRYCRQTLIGHLAGPSRPLK